jgi:hypothetical protein
MATQGGNAVAVDESYKITEGFCMECLAKFFDAAREPAQAYREGDRDPEDVQSGDEARQFDRRRRRLSFPGVSSAAGNCGSRAIASLNI